MHSFLSRYHHALTLEYGLSEASVVCYYEEAVRFCNYNLSKTNDEEITAQDIQDYLLHRQKHNQLTLRSLARVYSALNRWFQFLFREKIVLVNPLEEVERPRYSDVSLPLTIESEQIENLFESISLDTPLGLRDRALLELIYSCGLRISEALSLELHHVYWESSIILVMGKGGKERLLPLGEEAYYWFNRYINEARGSLMKLNNPHSFIFVNHQGKPLSRKGAWKNFKSLCGEVNLEAKLHTLRHSFASHLLNNGAPLPSVQLLLGHANLVTTEIYTHLDKSKLEARHQEIHEQYLAPHYNKKLKKDTANEETK